MNRTIILRVLQLNNRYMHRYDRLIVSGDSQIRRIYQLFRFLIQSGDSDFMELCISEQNDSFRLFLFLLNALHETQSQATFSTLGGAQIHGTFCSLVKGIIILIMDREYSCLRKTKTRKIFARVAHTS